MGEACSDLNMQRRVPLNSPRGLMWYALQTGYRYENRVAVDLNTKGFETYLPLIREVHQWKDRRKVMDVPAFGGYLFVRYEPSLNNRVKVLETTGVVRLLGGNNAPIQVPDVEIEALKRALNSGRTCSRCEWMTPGTLVKVQRGPLAGIQGSLVRVKNGLRLVIVVSAVSQAISAELDLQDVEPVDALRAVSKFHSGLSAA